MGKFFDQFPKVIYDIDGNRTGSYDIATNLFVRVGILSNIKNNSAVYYPYSVQEGDTPEMVADKYYGDPEYHWLVLYMNDMLDPFYDWPLSYAAFSRYMTNKYGSIATSQSGIHHYEKQIVRNDSRSTTTTTSKMVIDLTAYNLLAVSAVNTYNLTDGTTVSETITRNAVTNWEYENDLNERKRPIKLLKKEYLETVKNSFQLLMQQAPEVAQSVLTPRVT